MWPVLEPRSTGVRTLGSEMLGFFMCREKQRTKEQLLSAPSLELFFRLFPISVNSCFLNAAFAFELLLWWSSVRKQSWTLPFHRKDLYVSTVLISANNGRSRTGGEKKKKPGATCIVMLLIHSCIWLATAFCFTLGHVCFAMLKTCASGAEIMPLSVQLYHPLLLIGQQQRGTFRALLTSLILCFGKRNNLKSTKTNVFQLMPPGTWSNA